MRKRHLRLVRPAGLDRRAASERGGVGLGQSFRDARLVPFRCRLAEVDGPQLGHELTPQLRAAGGEQFGSHPEPLRGRPVLASADDVARAVLLAITQPIELSISEIAVQPARRPGVPA